MIGFSSMSPVSKWKPTVVAQRGEAVTKSDGNFPIGRFLHPLSLSRKGREPVLSEAKEGTAERWVRAESVTKILSKKRRFCRFAMHSFPGLETLR
jgi:hypothetical protein